MKLKTKKAIALESNIFALTKVLVEKRRSCSFAIQELFT
jgi:hypothetical protein